MTERVKLPDLSESGGPFTGRVEPLTPTAPSASQVRPASVPAREIQLEPVHYLDLVAIKERGIPPIEWLLPGWLAAQDIAVIAGDGGIGKSTTAARLALALGDGGDWCGVIATKAIRVLYFDEEQSEAECSRMFLRLGAPCSNLHIACQSGVNLTTAEGLGRLEREIRDRRPQLVIFDSAQQAFVGVDENDAGQVSRVYAELFRLRREYGVTFVILHHMRKPPGDGRLAGIHMVRGSTAHVTQCSTVWLATQPRLGILDLTQAKRRGGERISLRIHYETQGPGDPITLVGEGPVEAQETITERAQDFVATYLAEHADSPTAWILEAGKAAKPAVGERAVNRALKHLIDLGTVEKVKRGYYSLARGTP